jgi:DNA topoisomerase-1
VTSSVRSPSVAVTRSSVTVTDDRVTATEGDRTLEVTVHETYARTRQSTSEAGVRVGDCPCGGPLVRAGGVTCPDCGTTTDL